MIRKILTTLICLILTSCGGFTVSAGLKPSDSFMTLEDGTSIIFERPVVGKCGSQLVFFGIVLPIIPVWYKANSCEKSFDIEIIISDYSQKQIHDAAVERVSIKLKYGNRIFEPIEIGLLKSTYGKNGEYEYVSGKKFKFYIDDFWKFRMADDKAIVVIGKTKSGKEFNIELPSKWRIEAHDSWSFPG